MEHYLTVRIVHGAAAVLLILGLLVHLFLLWRARTAEPDVLARKLRRTRLVSLPLFAVLWLSLPVSGWWLTHWAAMPLGQKWLLISILLLPLFVPFGLLLSGNLGRWQRLLAAKQKAGGRQQIFALVWLLVIVLLLLGISGLMGAKPL